MSKFARLSLGLSAIGGVTLAVLYGNDKFGVKAATPANKSSHEHGRQYHLGVTNPDKSQKWDFNWDLREELQSTGESKKKTPVRNIILIRHGQYNMNHKVKDLTELGKVQAKYTGERLKELNIPINKIINSTKIRAKETADVIAEIFPDVPRYESSLLEEGAPIEPEPQVRHYQPPASYFVDGARIEAAFRKIFYRPLPEDGEKSTYDVVVCHGNVIRYFFCRALQFPPEAWLRLSVSHGSITWFVVSGEGRVSCRTLGESGYMPASHVTR